jgi:hypothetical protein
LTQPIAEAVEPGVGRKSLTAEAVTALGVDVQFGGLAGRVPGGVEANAVSGRYEGVIAGTTDELNSGGASLGTFTLPETGP